MHHCPFGSRCNQCTGKNHGVKRNVIFAHKLHQLDISCLVTPPFSPLIRVCSSNTNVADGRIEPDVEDLVCVALQGDGCAPFEIPGDAPLPQTLTKPGLRHCNRVLRPCPRDGCLLDVLFKAVLELWKVEEEMFCLPNLWFCLAGAALWRNELDGVQQSTAVVALITTGVFISTEMARASHKAIGQEPLVLVAEELLQLPIDYVAILVGFPENFLTDLRLLRRGGSTKMIERDVEPVIHISMQRIVLIADLLRTQTLLLRLRFRCCAVLIRSTDVDARDIPLSQVSRVDIRGQHGADQISQVRHIVHVRQCRRNQHVPLSRNRSFPLSLSLYRQVANALPDFCAHPQGPSRLTDKSTRSSAQIPHARQRLAVCLR
mmetsp:Transcript_8283/g.24877  ORF Transcript_8283/g.24877 Transcript_8283/m.24877 type:complete len:375 (-) Transcript_8283:109-1233(-)